VKRVSLSYSADSEEHRARVLALAQQLRREGVDAMPYVLAPAAKAQAAAGEPDAPALDAADLVLAVCTRGYRSAFEEQAAQDGGGADGAERIAQLAARSPGRVVPVLLEDGAPQFVPLALRSVPAVYLPEQLPQLLRQLGATGAPAPPLPAPAPAPALGQEAATRADAGTRRPARQIANVPLVGNADFAGRTFELAAIRKAFATPRHGGGSEPLIVIGPPGVGKTALALQHAYAQQDAYDVIWLVRAESESTIRLDLALLARELGLIAAGIVDDEAEVLAARSWLAAHDRWLVIFDEAASAEALGRYLPRPLRGHVLVTSRGSDWREAGKKLLLSSLAREETINLLLRASGRADLAGADELAAWLEGHPLMAKLTGALARDRGVAFDVLHRQLVESTGARPGHRLEAILAMAVEGARQRSPSILALVELIAYLAPHEIPIRLLRDNVEHLPPELGAVARDDLALAQLLDDLVRLGMITRDDSSLSVHAAVQAAIRATAKSGAAVALLDAAFGWDEERPETWAAAEELLPHVLVAIEDPHAPAAQPRALQRLLVRTAACTWKRGEPYRAVALQRRAIALLEGRIGGPGAAGEAGSADGAAGAGADGASGGAAGGAGADPRVALADALAALGSMLREVGELIEAAAQLERARELIASTEGAGETVPLLRELAWVAAARGDFTEARGQLQRALEVDHEHLGVDDHLSIAATLSELSSVELEADRLDDAAQLLDQALAMQRRVLGGDDHPQVAATLKRSAAILERRGDLAGAREKLERALEILRRVLRTDHHVEIVEVMGHLASVLLRVGEPVGAQRLLEQTLEIQARLFGSGASPKSAVLSANLARVLLVQGDAAGARRQLERTLLELQVHGLATHRAAAPLLEQFAELDEPTDPAAARARLEQALAIRHMAWSPDSAKAIRTVARLAQVTVRLGEQDEARRLLEPIVAQVAAWVELAAPQAEALIAVADALRMVGDAERARALLESAVATLERDVHCDRAVLARGKLALARALFQLEDLVEARLAAREACELSAAALGRRSPAVGEAALLCAEIALAGDEPASALAFAARALRALDDRGDGATRDRAGYALALAGRAALELGRRATAAALLQRSLERRDAPEVRETLFELVEELAAERPAYDAAPAVALLQRLAPSWLADRMLATAALDAAQITTRLEVTLSVTGAATAAAIAPVAGPQAAPPGARDAYAGLVGVYLASVREGHVHKGARDALLAPPNLPPPPPLPPPQQQLPPPSEYGWRLELAPIRAEGAASEARTLEARPRYVGRGRLALTASTADLPWGTYLLTVRFVDGARTVWRADVTISNVEMGNPFLAGPPVRGERFFGRARLLEDMLHHLEDASIVLLGPRRSGKTSVLYRLAQLCADSWTVVVVDLHGYSGLDDGLFLRELAGQIARAAGIDAPEADRPLLALRRALGAGARRILLLLDEMAILARYPDAALQLRAMSKWESPVVHVVIAGTLRDLDRLTMSAVRGSSPVNEFLNRELDQLTRQEALSLLEQPVLGRYRYEEPSLERLLELGAGRPFFLNALAHLTLEVVRQEGGRVITPAHVDAARQEAPGYLARWYRELVGELDDGSRASLPQLIEAGGGAAGPHAEALRSAGIVVGPRRAMSLDPIFIDWWRRGGNR
jgi:tetratricopeptide (TPR) repeat protein